MVVSVRNRRGVVSSVLRHRAPVLHFVDVEYDGGETPVAESLIREREQAGRLITSGALPAPWPGLLWHTRMSMPASSSAAGPPALPTSILMLRVRSRSSLTQPCSTAWSRS